MAVSYPDIIGNYVASPERYDAGGVHFAGYFEPKEIGPGGVASLFLFVQNNLNVPAEINFELKIPKSGGFFRAKKPLLEIKEPELSIKMTAGEAGLLTIPVTTTEHTKPGSHSLQISAKSETKDKGNRVRPGKSKSHLGTEFFDSPVGLDLVSSMGATYVEKSAKKVSFSLSVTSKAPLSDEKPDMTHNYQTIWTGKEVKFFNQAVQELNNRQVKLRNELNVEKLFVNLYGESVKRFADAGLPLRIGEAITLAKILTYSCQYFLSNPKRSNGLLVPIWERAFEQEADTTDTLDMVRTVGFYHILRLSVAMSFGIIGRVFGKQPWSLEERQAVGLHIADNIETGQPLDIEFLYLPLLMAGTQISSKIKLQGEDVSQSLALIKKAREARTDLFTDQDLAKADKIYNRILSKVA